MATLATQQLITSLYVAAFGRAPDKGGLAYWSAQMDAGLSYDNVVYSFLSSPEAEVRYGKDVSEQTFLANLYSNVLNRAVDEGGAKYWQGRFNELGNRKDLVKEILSSINESSGADHQLLQNKVEVGLKFAASISGYDQSYAKSILNSVTNDPASVVTARYVNESYDNPPVAAGPVTGSLKLHEDTGISLIDGLTKNGMMDVSFLNGAPSWEYSVNNGNSWTVGNGVSFTLAQGSFAAGQVQIRFDETPGVQKVVSSSDGYVVDTTAPILGSISSDQAGQGGTTARLGFGYTETIYSGPVKSFEFAFKSFPGSVVLNQISVAASTIYFDAENLTGNKSVALILPSGIVTDAAGNSSELRDLSFINYTIL